MRMEWLRASDNFPACWACFLVYDDRVDVLAITGSRQRIDPMKHAYYGLICASVDGITRRRRRLSGIRCRIENCVRSFTAVNLNHVPPDAMLVCPGARLLSVRAIITELPALVIRRLQPIEMR